MKNKLIKKAIILRKSGNSFKQIHKKLAIAKSTCYIWLKDVKLSKSAKQKLIQRGNEGRQRGWVTNHKKLLARTAETNKKVQNNFKAITLNGELFKLICAMLYWAEGNKDRRGINFTNSDPEMIKVFLTLLRGSFNLAESRFQASLHLHSYHNQRKQKQFWSKITNIPLNKVGIYLKSNTGKNTRPGYPGCISIRYNDVAISEELKAYYKIFAKNYGGLVQW